MRYAVGVPNVEAYGDPRAVVELARDAEAAGWDGLFLWDHIYRENGAPATDPWVALAAVAMATERLRLGALVTPVARRRPWKLARETVALDLLSEGRLVVGAGLGSRGDVEFEPFGEDPDPRVRAEKLDEGLEVLAALWSGEPVDHDGRHYRVADRTFLPTPLQSPRIPVWIAGRWPGTRPFRRAARWDGVFPTGHRGAPLAPADVADVVAYTLGHREGDGPFDVAHEGTSPADPGEAGELLGAHAAAGLTWWIERVGWFRGTAAEMRDLVRAGPPG